MTDLRSFVRYLVPGLTFLIEFVLVLAAASYTETVSLLGGSLKAADIGSIFGAALALGGLGYLASVAHHSLCWSSLGSWYNAVDLRAVIQRLQAQNLLVLERQEGSAQPVGALSRAGAWRIFTALWHSRRETSNRIKGATVRADSLSDLMHGSGSAVVACVLAVLAALAVSYSKFEHISLFTAGATAVLLVLVHWNSYRHTGAQAQGFAELVLFEELASQPTRPTAAPSGESESPSPLQGPFILRVSKREQQVH
jgi:predicted membrane channel-forming protein YqfA (hemolysin III family)